jgi:ABC-type antimicrobial peptide transport system permease subunit
MSCFVNERAHEIGTRGAWGARPLDVIGPVGTLGLERTSIGIVIGIALAAGFTRLLSEFFIRRHSSSNPRIRQPMP